MRLVLLSTSLSGDKLAETAYAAALMHGRTAEPRITDEIPDGYVEIKPGAYGGWRLVEPVASSEERKRASEVAEIAAKLAADPALAAAVESAVASAKAAL